MRQILLPSWCGQVAREDLFGLHGVCFQIWLWPELCFSIKKTRARSFRPTFQFLGIHPSYVTICVCSHIWRAKTSSAKHSLLLQFMFMLEAGQMALSCGPALRASTQEKRLAADLGAFGRQKSCVQQSYVCKWFVSASCRSGNGIWVSPCQDPVRHTRTLDDLTITGWPCPVARFGTDWETWQFHAFLLAYERLVCRTQFGALSSNRPVDAATTLCRSFWIVELHGGKFEDLQQLILHFFEVQGFSSNLQGIIYLLYLYVTCRNCKKGAE